MQNAECKMQNEKMQRAVIAASGFSSESCILAFAFAAVIAFGCWSIAQVPATQPDGIQAANEPAADAPMRQWFDRLADPDPKVREQAKIDLMGISGNDLRKFRQLVIDHQPIAPSQAAVLHDIVEQIFLANMPYDEMNVRQTVAGGLQSPYFLGILWEGGLETEDRLGVTVDERLPGFPSFRYLRTGDMILGVFLDPKISLLQLPNQETHTRDQLTDAIKNSDVRNIVLLVLREGEQVRIPVKLAVRPIEADRNTPGLVRPFIADRENKADAYWEENFVPLLENHYGGEIAE